MSTYDYERERRRQELAAERARKAAERQRKAEAQQQRLKYIEAMKDQAQSANAKLNKRMERLQSFLVESLPETACPSHLDLRREPRLPVLRLGDLENPVPPPQWADFAPPRAGWLKRKLLSSAVAEEASGAEAAFLEAQQQYAQMEEGRQRQIIHLREQHDRAVREAREKVDAHNRAIDEMASRVASRDKGAVEEYLKRTIDRLRLPGGFPKNVQIAYDPKDEHVVVEAELPSPDCVPEVKSVRYVQTRDELVETPRSPKERAETYRLVVAQFCLLLIRVFLNADEALRTVSFNGRVTRINPATGREERPHILSVVVERSHFDKLVLERVRADECLRHLRALVSPHPFELEAVEPLVEFDRSRLAFIEGVNVVSGLDARPDLMAMSPLEFEHLIREVLEADPTILSVESLTTRASNDGGVDGVVYINQPFGRSMTVVQAKQYARNRSLGPAHIRELIGAMHEVKAGNGLLVTTSNFTATARANAADFGRISLIDGNNLVYMIKNLLGKDVLIGDARR